MTYGLPTTLEVGGREYAIRSDFRDILEIMEALNDVNLSDQDRGYITLLIFYPEFDTMPPENYEEAIRQCYWFLNGGHAEDDSGEKSPRLMDWEQDYPLIIAPVSRVLGHDARTDAHLHWWTFLGAYMEIGDCTFAQVVRIRDQQSKGKPLDKADREWYRKNQRLVDMKTDLTSSEKQELLKWGGGTDV